MIGVGSIQFQSTLPLRGATCTLFSKNKIKLISIHAPLVGRDSQGKGKHNRKNISIHAPLVGRDEARQAPVGGLRHDFNPRAPCGARRFFRALIGRVADRFQSTRPLWGATLHSTTSLSIVQFQSTRPLWGATRSPRVSLALLRNFNPRAPCGARLLRLRCFCFSGSISIHAPLVGRDFGLVASIPYHWYFNPRAPCGARHSALSPTIHRSSISIHAPLVGRDGTITRSLINVRGTFQSTRPLWGATSASPAVSRFGKFQSTRPLWGATLATRQQEPTCSEFQSTRPLWGATDEFPAYFVLGQEISIHAPLVGRDELLESWHVGSPIFQSTRPLWGATKSLMH